MARLINMEKVHAKFVKSEQYRKMPREQEIAKERAELQSDRQEAVTEMLKEAGEEQEVPEEDAQEGELAGNAQEARTLRRRTLWKVSVLKPRWQMV